MKFLIVEDDLSVVEYIVDILDSTNIASELGCSLKTVKRELDTLRLAGHIEFVGPSKTGTYRLVGA